MENIRTECFLGNNKVIIGNKYTDLVLETLGKVYVKTGNNSRVLSDVLKLLDQTQETEIKDQIIIVDSTKQMEDMEYPGDGVFVFNSLTSTLYISYDLRYILLVSSPENTKEGYVRRSGDTMTGQLEINTVGPPLIIASSKLVNNLNVEYLNGYSSDDLAKKKIDEYIYGNWTFKGTGVSESNWIFNDNVRMYGDLVTSRSITSPEFASGFGGYGWRLDSDTNTLTVDYLVVRKTMRVYEMVINKISATNGSIWVTNSSKCDSAVQPIILTEWELQSATPWSNEVKEKFLRLLQTNTYYLPVVPTNIDNTVELTSEISKPSSINSTSKTFVNYKFIIYIKDPISLVNSPLFEGPQTLYNETLLTSEWDTYQGTASEKEYLAFKKYIQLYYINKEVVVTEWDEDNNPVEQSYEYTFDKDISFFMIPKTSEAATDFEEKGQNSEYLTQIKTYYKYFALDQDLINNAITESNNAFNEEGNATTVVPNLWVVNTDDNEYPLFKPGDIIRCQKYNNGNIKYYDALIMSQIGSRQYIVQRATSVFDIYTEIHYNEDGTVESTKEEYNKTQYNKTETSFNVNTGTYQPKSTTANEAQEANPDTDSDQSISRLDDIVAGDDMIQMGNIFDPQRQNAIYLTSCDDDGPFIDVISGLNRPDYSVLYDIPVYETREIVYNSTKKKYYIQKEEVANAPTINEVIDDQETILYGTLYPTKFSIIKKVDNKYKHAYTKTTRVRVGNLDGIYNEIFGNKQPYGFGLYGENVFLTGEFYLNNGSSVVNFAQDGIFLKFKEAGLEIVDLWERDPSTGEYILDSLGQKIPIYRQDEDGNFIVDSSGNKIQKQGIKLYADEIHLDAFKTYIGSDNINTLFTVKDGKAYIKTDLIDAESIRVDEIYNETGELEDKTFIVPLTEALSVEASTFIDSLNSEQWITTFNSESGNLTTKWFWVLILHKDVPIKFASSIIDMPEVGNIECKFANISTSLPEYQYNIQLYNIDTKEFVTSVISNGRDPINLEVKSAGKYVVIYEVQYTQDTTSNLSVSFSIQAKYQGVKNEYYWALWKQGNGELAKGNIIWDTEGNLNLIGTFTTGKYEKNITMYHSKSTDNPIFALQYNNNNIVEVSYSVTNDSASGYMRVGQAPEYTSIRNTGIQVYKQDTTCTISNTFRISSTQDSTHSEISQTFLYVGKDYTGREFGILEFTPSSYFDLQCVYITKEGIYVGSRLEFNYKDNSNKQPIAFNYNIFNLEDQQRVSKTFYRYVIKMIGNGTITTHTQKCSASIYYSSQGVLPMTLFEDVSDWTNVSTT